MQKLIYLSMFLLSLSACSNLKVDSIFNGIYVMEDNKKMIEFLDAKESTVGYYGLELNLKAGKAKIRFINSRNEYTVDIKKISYNKYQLVNKNKSREFSLEKYYNDVQKKNVYFWHFADSKPKFNHSSRDGSSEDVKNLDDCIKQLQADHEFAEQERAAGPLDGGN